MYHATRPTRQYVNMYRTIMIDDKFNWDRPRVNNHHHQVININNRHVSLVWHLYSYQQKKRDQEPVSGILQSNKLKHPLLFDRSCTTHHGHFLSLARRSSTRLVGDDLIFIDLNQGNWINLSLDKITSTRDFRGFQYRGGYVRIREGWSGCDRVS